MSDLRYSDDDVTESDVPSYKVARSPLRPFKRRITPKGTNLLKLFEEDLEIEEPERMQVYLRLKPCKIPNNLYEIRSDRCLVTSLNAATVGHGLRTQHNVSKTYTFSKIFGAECNQNEIFETVVKENLRKLLDGQNFTLLSYGASGSGKTFTLMGTVRAPGLVPRSLEYVFRLVDAAQHPAFKPAENGIEMLSHERQDCELQMVKRLCQVSTTYRDRYRRMSAQLHSESFIDQSKSDRHYVWVSFVEIYNDAVYDLLVPTEKKTKLIFREDTSGNVYVKGAKQAFVRSAQEAYNVLVAGKHNLMVAATGVHAHSSRSHCIFTITMLTETGSGLVRASSVRLCDLAGCERARTTRNEGARMAESRAINSSLHTLERCLHMLRSKQKSGAMVPYRESKLTRLLGTALSGAKGESVNIVVTLNPSPEYVHETKHVLGFAVVAQDIPINNTIYPTTMERSTPRTTILYKSAEVMKSRADVDQLNFELLQSQACIKELMASMGKKQQETANTKRELVQEAKDFTKTYYEYQLEALQSPVTKLRADKAELEVTKLRAEKAELEVTKLRAEKAELEEKLTAEHLARVREVLLLRASLAKEKVLKDGQESDKETDLLNESLEPIYSLKNYRNTTYNIETHYESGESTENFTIHTDNEVRVEEAETRLKNESFKCSNLNLTYIISDNKHDEKCDFSKDVKEKKRNPIRGTYFVKDTIITSESDEQEPITEVFKVSKVDCKLAENMTRKIVRDKSYDDMKTTAQISKDLDSKLISEESIIDKASPKHFSENLYKNINREKSNTDMRAKKVSEPLVSKIIRAKSDLNMKVPEKVSDNITRKIINIPVDIFNVFNSPDALKTKEKVDNVDIASQSLEKVVLGQQSDKKTPLPSIKNTELRLYIREEIEPEEKEMKFESMSSVEESDDLRTKLEPASSIAEPRKTMNETQAKGDNTMEEFEKNYKEITAPRANEYDLLVSQVKENGEKHEKEKIKYNLQKKHCKTVYSNADKSKDGEILVESQAKSETKVSKRALRFRNRKNINQENYDQLKAISNLQTKFSDATLDVPAPQKEIRDIPSPEMSAKENLPPFMVTQSCPSKSFMKSITRSRRKLFNPRAEPLEESPIHSGDSNERIYVTRPSYDGPRARRKLY